MTALASETNEILGRYRPYPNYLDSGVEWLGELPAHWETRRLKTSLCRNDGGVWGDDFDNDGTIVLRSTEQTVGGDWQIDEPARRSLSATEKAGARLSVGDLLVTKSSGSELHIGKTTIVTPEVEALDCCFSNFMQRVRCKPSVHPWFVYYILNSGIGREQFVFGSNSTTGLANLNGGIIGNLWLGFPSFDEQRAIAAFLDRETARIDELVTEKQRLIELLAEKRTALISHVVTKGINPDAPMKDSGIDWLGQVPDHWRLKKLRFLADGGLENGLFKKKQFFGSGVRLVNVFDVYREDFLIDERTLERVEADAVETRRYAVEPGDIFFVRSSLKLEGVGKSACMLELSEPAVFECHLVRMQPRQNAIRSHFLINFLNSVPATNRLIALANQVTMTTIDQDKFKSLEVPVPPLEEQETIIELLSEQTRTFFALTSSVREAIDKLREYRSALISAAVTGKIDVRELVAEDTPCHQ